MVVTIALTVLGMVVMLAAMPLSFDPNERFYGELDGSPVIASYVECWIFANDEWKLSHPAEFMMSGRQYSKAKFDQKFPNLPALPDEAFKVPYPA